MKTKNAAATKPKSTTLVSRARKGPGSLEALESRIAPAVVLGVHPGTHLHGTHYFLDATGDLVTVTLSNRLGHVVPGDFYSITLDGGAVNLADVQEIDVTGSSIDFLKIKVQSEATGRNTFTPGFADIGLISGGDLAGISLRAANADDIEFTGSVGTIAVDIRPLNYANLSTTEMAPGLSTVGFGEINVAGAVGTISLRGLTTFTNDLQGLISVGSLGFLDAPYSDLVGGVTVAGGSTNSVLVHDILGPLNLSNVKYVEANNIQGNVTATTITTELSATGDISGDVNISGTSAGNLTVISEGTISGNIYAPNTPITLTLGSAPNAVTGSDATLTGSITAASLQGTSFAAGGVTDLLKLGGGNFNGVITTTTGGVGPIAVTATGGLFEGVISSAGAVGNLSAAGFENAVVSGAGIGSITANGNHTGIENSTFTSTAAIGAVSSVEDISESTFNASGAIGSVNSSAGQITASAILSGAAIGNISANGSITGNVINAVGAIGNITSVTGGIGGGSLASDGGAAPANSIIGGAIGNITALGDISGNVIHATAGNIGAITASNGRIAFDDFSATGSIGAVTAHSVGTTEVTDIYGNTVENGVASAIDSSNFSAGTTIGAITATAPNTDSTANAIVGSNFSAGTGIGAINATASSVEDFAAIESSTFVVTGAGLTGLVIGPVVATGSGGEGIDNTAFHAVSGNIGNISGTSILDAGISDSHIAADTGNVGNVSGTGLGGQDGEGGPGIVGLGITAGAQTGGTGSVGTITGTSLDSDGISETLVAAGSGGIGAIMGTNTGNANASTGAGITGSQFFTTGAVASITGTSTSSSGIVDSDFSADGNLAVAGNITGETTSTSAGDSGIVSSIFRSGANIGNVIASTAIASATAISGTETAGAANLIVPIADPHGPTPVAGGGNALVKSPGPLTQWGVNVPSIGSGGGGAPTIFSALGNIGNFTVAKGDINGVLVLAGYDIGSDLSFDGIAGGKDFIPAPGTATTVGTVTVSQGNIMNSAFTSGVVFQGPAVGTPTDALNVIDGGSNNSSIGEISAANNGLLSDVVVEADALNPGGTIIQATEATQLYLKAFTEGIGAINLTGTLPGFAVLSHSAIVAGGSIGQFTIGAPPGTSGSAGDGVLDSLIWAGSNGTIQNIAGVTVTTNGGNIAPPATGSTNGYANAIDGTAFIATGNVGNIVATVNNATGPFAGSAIINSYFRADSLLNGAGTIGSITASTNGQGGPVTSLASGGSDAIYNSTFHASSGIGLTGGITASVLGVGGGDGISNTVINADFDSNQAGVVGNVTVTSVAASGNGIVQSAITGSSVGNILVDPAGNDGIGATEIIATGIPSASDATIGSIGTINVTVGIAGTSGGNDAIVDSLFFATANIGAVTAVTAGFGPDTTVFGTTAPNPFSVPSPILPLPTGAASYPTAPAQPALPGGIDPAGHSGIANSSFTAGGSYTLVGAVGAKPLTIVAGATGSIGTITATTLHGDALSTHDDGIFNSNFSAATGGIGAITASATPTGEDGINASNFTTSGTITSVTVGSATAGAANAGAGDVAINGSTFTASGGIGAVIGHTSGSATAENSGSGFTGIATSTFTAGAYSPVAAGLVTPTKAMIASGATGGITSVTGLTDHSTATSTIDDGIFLSGFYAGTGGIGPVIANATSTGEDGIFTGTFVTSGSITSVTVGSATAGAANAGAGDVGILTSTFTATAGIGPVIAHTSGSATVDNSGTGFDGINGSTFTAGANSPVAAGVITPASAVIGSASAGGITSITALTDHALATGVVSTLDDGIDTSKFFAGTGGIGPVIASATSTGEDGIRNSIFTTSGTIASVSVGSATTGAANAGAGDVGILGSTFTATVGIGAVIAHTSGSATVENSATGFDGIDGSSFTAGAYSPVAAGVITPTSSMIATGAAGAITSITAITDHALATGVKSTTDDAIFTSHFFAGTGGIGPVTALGTATSNDGINTSTFLTTGAIGTVTVANAGAAAVGHIGINASTFTAIGNIGAVLSITAGADTAGVAASADDGILGSTFTAGAASATTTAGAVTVPAIGTVAKLGAGAGGIASITAITNQTNTKGTTDDAIKGSLFFAGTGGIGPVTATGTTTSEDGITGSTFATTGSIGQVLVATATGAAAVGDVGIFNSSFIAGGGIGDVIAHTSGNASVDTAGFGFDGIWGNAGMGLATAFSAGTAFTTTPAVAPASAFVTLLPGSINSSLTGTAGGIGFINATTDHNLATGVVSQKDDGIRGVTFTAGLGGIGVTATGTIATGGIVAQAGTGVSTARDGIESSTFTTSGSIGNVSVGTAALSGAGFIGINLSTFTAAGSIGNVIAHTSGAEAGVGAPTGGFDAIVGALGTATFTAGAAFTSVAATTPAAPAASTSGTITFLGGGMIAFGAAGGIGNLTAITDHTTTASTSDDAIFDVSAFAANGGIGNIQATAENTVPAPVTYGRSGINGSIFTTAGNIGTITVADVATGLLAGAGGTAIFGSTFTAAGSIGNIVAHTNGSVLAAGLLGGGDDAISTSSFSAGSSFSTTVAAVVVGQTTSTTVTIAAPTAGNLGSIAATTGTLLVPTQGTGSIGSITATADHANGAVAATTVTTDDAIFSSDFVAGTGGIGVTGGITANGTATSEDGIHSSTFLTTGSIGNISVGTVAAAGAGDVAIFNSNFTAVGSIGNIIAHTSGNAPVDNSAIGFCGIGDAGFTAGSAFTTTPGAPAAGGVTLSGSIVPTANLIAQTAAGSTQGTGGVGSVTGITDHNLATGVTSGFDDGIFSLSVFAGTAGIGAVTGTAGTVAATTTAEDGINASNLSTTGSIGAISGSGGEDGIFLSTFAAVGNIGAVTGQTSGLGALNQGVTGELSLPGAGAAAKAGFDGIGFSSFTAGAASTKTAAGVAPAPLTSASIALTAGQLAAAPNTGSLGAVTGTSLYADAVAGTTGNGINNSAFLAGSGGIASITGTTTGTAAGDNGIVNSIARTLGSILGGAGTAAITAKTGDASAPGATHGAIVNSAFDAEGNIGSATVAGVSATGHLQNTAFVAGVDLGNNFEGGTATQVGNPATSGATADGTNTAAALAYLGYGGAAGAADTAGGAGTGIIGAITLVNVGATPAKIGATYIIAGITALNGAGTIGIGDTVTPGSGVGAITAPGGIDPTLVAGGSIGATTITNGSFDADTYFAGDPTGSGIGSITASLTAVAGANNFAIGDFNLQTTLSSVTNIGNISGTVTGTRATGAFYTDGIYSLIVQAGGVVGSITGTNTTNAGTIITAPGGIIGLDVSAGTNAGITAATVTVGAISGTLSDNVTAGLFGFGISQIAVDAGAGSIASINGASASASGYGIGYPLSPRSVFYAAGGIGAITASGSVDAVDNTLFSAGGNIASITTGAASANGTILSGVFVAGYEEAHSNPVTSAAVALFTAPKTSVGAVTVNGNFDSSTIVASVIPGTANVWGGLTDADNAGGGGTIGTVIITGAEAPIVAATAATVETSAIEAASISSVTVGGVGQINGAFGIVINAGTGNDVLIRIK